jgi:large subunit ribosomal protein L5e
LAQAHSKELIRYGLPVGLKNYAASYCTGLLLARRLLTKLNLQETYSGVEEITGAVQTTDVNGRTYYMEEIDEEKKPFRCLLDVGVRNTTTGARIFAALKGASDGGLDIPHNHKRFPGYTKDTKQFDAEMHKGHIMGEHIADYMREMEDDDEENYAKHFAKYVENGISADDLETKLEEVHEAIRADPVHVKAAKYTGYDKSFKKDSKISHAQRKAASEAKKAALKAGDDDEEDDN